MNEDTSLSEHEPRIFYGVKEVMHLLNIGRTGLYEEIRSGRLESFTRGRQRLFSHDALKAYKERIEQEGKEVSPYGSAA